MADSYRVRALALAFDDRRGQRQAIRRSGLSSGVSVPDDDYSALLAALPARLALDPRLRALGRLPRLLERSRALVSASPRASLADLLGGLLSLAGIGPDDPALQQAAHSLTPQASPERASDHDALPGDAPGAGSTPGDAWREAVARLIASGLVGPADEPSLRALLFPYLAGRSLAAALERTSSPDPISAPEEQTSPLVPLSVNGPAQERQVQTLSPPPTCADLGSGTAAPGTDLTPIPLPDAGRGSHPPPRRGEGGRGERSVPSPPGDPKLAPMPLVPLSVDGEGGPTHEGSVWTLRGSAPGSISMLGWLAEFLTDPPATIRRLLGAGSRQATVLAGWLAHATGGIREDIPLDAPRSAAVGANLVFAPLAQALGWLLFLDDGGGDRPGHRLQALAHLNTPAGHDDPLAHLASASLALDAGDHHAVLQGLDRAEQALAHAQAALAHLRGHACDVTGESERSADWYRRAAELAPTPHHLTHLAIARASAGDRSGAIALLQRTAASAGLDEVVEPLMALACLSQAWGDWAGTIAALTEVLAARPWQPGWHVALGHLCRLGGRRDRARAHLRLALERGELDSAAPDGEGHEASGGYRTLATGTAHSELGWLDLIQGDDQAAAAHFQAALRHLDETIPAAWDQAQGRRQGVREQARFGLALALLGCQRWADAAQVFRRQLTNSGNHLDLLGLGDALAGLGQESDAAECYRSALSSSERHPRVLAALGSIEVALGTHSSAIAHLGEALAADRAMAVLSAPKVELSARTACQHNGLVLARTESAAVPAAPASPSSPLSASERGGGEVNPAPLTPVPQVPAAPSSPASPLSTSDPLRNGGRSEGNPQLPLASLTAEERAAVRLLLAESLLSTGRPDEGLRRLDEIIADGAGGVVATRVPLVRARALRELGQPRDALDILRESAGASDEELLRELARTYSAVGELDLAIGVWDELRQRLPESSGTAVGVLLESAQALLRAGRLDAAEARAAEVRETDVAWPLAVGIYAECLLRRGQAAEALRRFQQALWIAPGEGWLGAGAACAQAALGDRAGAVETLRRGLADVGNDPLLWRELIRILIETGDIAAAREAAHAATAHFPHDADLLAAAGHAAAADGAAAEMLAHYRLALARRVDDPQLTVQFVEDALRLAIASEAVSLLAEHPASDAANRGRARLLATLGRWDEASELLGHLIAGASGDGAEDVALRLDYAAALARAGKLAEARRALASLPGDDVADSPARCRTLSDLLVAVGDLTSAVVVLERAAARWPDDPELHAVLGLCRREQGDVAGAVVALERAEALGSSPTARRQLVRAYRQLGRDRDATLLLERLAEEGDEAAPLELVEALAESGQVVRALDALPRALQAPNGAPREPGRLLRLVELFTAAGRWDAASRVLEAIPSDNDPSLRSGQAPSPEAALWRARCGEQAGDFATALRDYGRADATGIPAWLGLGRTLIRRATTLPDVAARDDLIAAIGWLERTLAHAPAESPVWCEAATLLGEANECLGRLAMATRWYSRVAGRENAAGDIFLALGRSLRASGDAARAVTILREAAERQPTSPALLRALAAAQREAGDLAGSLQSYRSAWSLAPDDLDGVFELRLAELYAGTLPPPVPSAAVALQSLGALRALQDLAGEGPAAIERWAMLGRLAERLHAPEQALHCYQRAETTGGGRARHLAGVGRALGRLRRWEEAARSFARATAALPDLWSIWCDQADVLTWRGYYKEALRAYDRARELGGVAPRIVAGMAAAEQGLGNLVRAEVRLRDALTSHPDDPLVLEQLASLAIARGHQEEASWAIDRALAHDPANPDLLYRGAQVALAGGKIDLASDRIRLAERIAPAWTAIGILHGELAARAGDWAGAAVHYEQVLSVERRPEALCALARAFQHLGRPDDAFALLKEAIEREPGRVSWWGELGELALATGKPDAAMQALRRAVELSPRDAVHRRRLGRALQRLGRLEEAAGALAEAVRLAPGDPEVYREYTSLEATRQLRGIPRGIPR